LRIVNDKSLVLSLAATLSIPTPRTYTLDSVDQSTDISQLRYPVVIKPSRSRILTESGLLAAGVDYAADACELAAKLRTVTPAKYPLLLQERIVGAGVGIFACYQHGRPVAFFSHRRLREKPPSGGVSVLCESIPLDQAALDYSQRLLSELRWHGVAMIEFKRDERSGALYLMEVNGRFWGSLQLAIDAGVNFPAIVATISHDTGVEPLAGYKTGIQLRWFLGDLDALLAVLFHGSGRLNLPPGYPGRMRALLHFLNSSRSGQRSEVFRLDDPRPGLLEWWQWLRTR
jgi:predicted ATP-grasp superfamily ATP-dependent carboligase